MVSKSAKILRRTWLLGASSALLTLPFVSPGVALGATADVLKEVAKARASLKTLLAPFEQTRVIGLLAEPVKSKGELTLVRPDQLRWELYAPDDVVYWVNKSGISYRAGKAAKPTSVPKQGGFSVVLDDLLTFLAGDLESLGSRYTFDATSSATGAVIDATPKADDLKKHLKRISMVTNAEKWGVAKIVIEDASGDLSTIVFGENKKDTKVDAARMKPS